MEVYFAIYFVALFLALRKKESSLSLLLLFFLFFATAFRAEDVGADTWNYLHNFSYETGSELAFSSRTLEFLNLGIYYMAFQMDLDTRLVLVLYAFITYFFVFLISKKYRIRLSYLLLFLFLTNFFIKGLNITRQVASVAILAWSISYIYDSKFRKSLLFFLGVLIAGSLHATSYIYCFLYLLRFVHFKDSKLVSIVTFLFSLFVVLNIFPLGPILEHLMPKEFDIYSDSIKINYTGSIIGILFIIFNVAIQCIIASRYKGEYLALFAVSIILCSTAVGMDFIVSRITLIFSLINCIIYCSYFKENYHDGFARIIMLIMIVTNTYFSFGAIASDPDLVHYHFCF